MRKSSAGHMDLFKIFSPDSVTLTIQLWWYGFTDQRELRHVLRRSRVDRSRNSCPLQPHSHLWCKCEVEDETGEWKQPSLICYRLHLPPGRGMLASWAFNIVKMKVLLLRILNDWCKCVHNTITQMQFQTHPLVSRFWRRLYCLDATFYPPSYVPTQRGTFLPSMCGFSFQVRTSNGGGAVASFTLCKICLLSSCHAKMNCVKRIWESF